MFCSDAVTSSTVRVLSPQSGLTHTCSRGNTLSVARSIAAISSSLGTRGEWSFKVWSGTTLKLVGQRRRMLTYLAATDVERYRALIGRLGLRR